MRQVHSGLIGWGLGFTLIILIAIVIGSMQAMQYNYKFSELLLHSTKIEGIIYLIIPIIHLAILIYFLKLIAFDPDMFYVVNALVSCEILVGIVHLFRRITKTVSVFNDVNSIPVRSGKDEKSVKNENVRLFFLFEYIGGRRG